MLQRFGLTSIGELARLPEADIASRLGEIGRALHRAARGIDPEPLIPRALPPEFREAMETEWPLVAIEPFLFVATAALERLAHRMELQGFAAKRIELTLTLEPDGFDARGIDLPAPTRDVKTLLTLIRLDLERRPPGAPVVGFALTAVPDRPRRAQLSLFGPSAVSPEKLATTIARLVAMLGDGRVGMPMTVDGHLPERHAIGAFDPPPPPSTRATPPGGAWWRYASSGRPSPWRCSWTAPASPRSAAKGSTAPCATPPDRGTSRKDGGAAPPPPASTSTSSPLRRRHLPHVSRRDGFRMVCGCAVRGVRASEVKLIDANCIRQRDWRGSIRDQP